MDLFSAIILIAVLGLVVYLVTEFIPMPPRFKQAILIVAGVGLFIILLKVLLGVLGVTVPNVKL